MRYGILRRSTALLAIAVLLLSQPVTLLSADCSCDGDTASHFESCCQAKTTARACCSESLSRRDVETSGREDLTTDSVCVCSCSRHTEPVAYAANAKPDRHRTKVELLVPFSNPLAQIANVSSERPRDRRSIPPPSGKSHSAQSLLCTWRN
jgi:hypothetical protein